MLKFVVVIPLLCISALTLAQVRVTTLVIKRNEVYKLNPSDIIVADTLIMMDSSRIILNGLKPENFIRASVAIIGNNCSIEGKGANGQRGRDGLPGATLIGPCRNGIAGRDGGRGLDGTPGIKLFLYIDKVKTFGSLTVDLSGGNGGDGGNGGPGGGGSPGTNQCKGGNGGNGGNAGAGGNGGDGGVLTLGGKEARDIRKKLGSTLRVFTKAGTFGYGGILGHSGPPGLGPNKRHGKGGVAGLDGQDGRPGTMGTILFENNY
jgi:hypothetical protein